VEQRAARTPDALIAIDDRGERITFGEFRDRAEVVAAGLHHMGINEDSVVSWQLPTWLESLVLAAALARLAAVQNPIIPLNREREVGFIVKQLRADLLIVPSTWRGFDFAQMAAGIQQVNPGLKVLVSDRMLPAGDPSTLPPPPVADEDPPIRWVLYTSGTTADPKGARHTDVSLMHSAYGMCERMQMTAADRNAIAFPVTHIGGLTLLFGDLIVGSASILLETFTDAGIAVLAREGVTLAGSGTPFNLAYLRAQRDQPDRPLFPAVRAFPGGGSSRPPELNRQMRDVFGVGILSGYGLTETGFLAFAHIDDPAEAVETTEGRAYPGCEIRLVDGVGSPVPAGVEGEICARGPMIMRGYVDDNLDTAFDADGYFHTGDLGILDASGYLSITGRLKEIIIRKGENISALEVENLMHSHPAVGECAVIGLPDPTTGERACAVVVLAPQSMTLTLDQLREHLRARGLSMHKIPEQLEIVDFLPKNATGKVTKRVLQAQFADQGLVPGAGV
jgi:cyclohexanecarboxylate-CoA ligase